MSNRHRSAGVLACGSSVNRHPVAVFAAVPKTEMSWPSRDQTETPNFRPPSAVALPAKIVLPPWSKQKRKPASFVVAPKASDPARLSGPSPTHREYLLFRG